ncbi:MAG TPA: glycoside hydrolase family 38 C-terminal domain-containing protein [Candidatus Limnocylindrales bacterium]|nr:glycoside hydrolase family 38 C-terminal domain-containing protein [Candidatus Limnocylindrales bacterium]
MSEPSAIYIVPHTHWDREWYAPFQVFRAQLVDLWDELLALTERDPDFRFLMDGQTVVIDDYLAIRPQSRPRVDRAIRSGQIQVGPWYTLPDEFLVSGETLVRDLQRGIADGDAHGGAMRVGYLPDSFGHASQMPQIYRQFGFRHAVVWRGVPSTIDRLAFEWEAPDGSRILTAYMGTTYSHGVDLPLDGPGLAARLRSTIRALEPFRPVGPVLLMNGNDHVLPQAGLTAAARSAGEVLGRPAKIARLDEYLATLPEEGWPRWTGELRASSRANVLMGTLSVRILDKQAAFEAALALERRAEPMSALAGLEAQGLLREAWTLQLQNAAHDTVCGSGIDAVAAEARLRSQAVQQIAHEIVQRAAARLRLAAGRPPDAPPAAVIWNPSPFVRDELVELSLNGVPTGGQDLGAVPAAPVTSMRFPAEELARLLAALDERRITGNPVRALRVTRRGAEARLDVETHPLGSAADLDAARKTVEQLAADAGVETFEIAIHEAPLHRVLLRSGPVLGCGLSVLTGTSAMPMPATAAVHAAAMRLENDRLSCTIRDDGTLSVHHRLTDTRYEGLLSLVDQGDAGDEYNFSPVGDPVVLTPSRAIEVRVLEPGPLRGALEISATVRIPAGLTLDRRRRRDELVEMPLRLHLSLDADSTRLDVDLSLEHRAADHRLRLESPLPFAAAQSDADGAFHVVRRPAVEPVHEPGAPEWELPTYPMRTFVDVSDGRRGLTLISRGLHEYELLPPPAARLALTLLRGVGWLSRDDLRYRLGHAGPMLETPAAQVPGRHRARFSLFFHPGDWISGGAWREAERALLPLEVLGPAPARTGPTGAPPSIVLEPDSVQMTACVPRPDGYDLRILNASDTRVDARAILAPVPISVVRSTLAGAPGESLRVDHGAARLPLGPWQIATLRVLREPVG